MDEAAKPHFKSSKRHGLFAKMIEMEIMKRNAIQVFIEILKIHKGRNITWALSLRIFLSKNQKSMPFIIAKLKLQPVTVC
ncbi:hypothetical protein ACN42_g10546 [Penicillium freii]|uniref:Uncharacterized protein n=1 Tax=Penicillium freii TaxID=48697 RepID=A0A124GQ12_PENFR|nr:hypothetical protein ACN42_g10546 [Penicillium freii]